MMFASVERFCRALSRPQAQALLEVLLVLDEFSDPRQGLGLGIDDLAYIVTGRLLQRRRQLLADRVDQLLGAGVSLLRWRLARG
jgi:hypothetical protein